MRFDLILPTYNNIAELKECLEALNTQSYTNFNALICVDGSTDGTMEYLANAKFSYTFKILTHNDNKNHGRNPTRNLALPHLNSDFIIMLDSDIKPVNDFIERHFNLLSSRRCLSLGDVIYTNTKENIWADYIQTRGKNKYLDLIEIPGYYLNTQNIGMRTSDFIASGGQDGNMTTYGGGDTEFGYRISKELNIPLIFNKKACGFSVMPKELDFALRQMEEFGRINLHYIHQKHPEFKSLFRFDLIETGSLKKYALKILTNRHTSNLIYKIIPAAPPVIRRSLIHLLVFNSIHKGYTAAIKQINYRSALN